MLSQLLGRTHEACIEVSLGRSVTVRLSTFKWKQLAIRVAWLGIVFGGFINFVLGTYSIKLLSALVCSLSVRRE